MAHVWIITVLSLWICCFSSGYTKEEACKWDLENERGLDPESFDDGANSVHLPHISDSIGCQQACCRKGDCQLAMLGTPADGTAECFLVSCMKDGKDVCVLRHSSQFKVFRKVTPAAQQAEGNARNGTCTGRLTRSQNALYILEWIRLKCLTLL